MHSKTHTLLIPPASVLSLSNQESYTIKSIPTKENTQHVEFLGNSLLASIQYSIDHPNLILPFYNTSEHASASIQYRSVSGHPPSSQRIYTLPPAELEYLHAFQYLDPSSTCSLSLIPDTNPDWMYSIPRYWARQSALAIRVGDTNTEEAFYAVDTGGETVLPGCQTLQRIQAWRGWISSLPLDRQFQSPILQGRPIPPTPVSLSMVKHFLKASLRAMLYANKQHSQRARVVCLIPRQHWSEINSWVRSTYESELKQNQLQQVVFPTAAATEASVSPPQTLFKGSDSLYWNYYWSGLEKSGHYILRTVSVSIKEHQKWIQWDKREKKQQQEEEWSFCTWNEKKEEEGAGAARGCDPRKEKGRLVALLSGDFQTLFGFACVVGPDDVNHGVFLALSVEAPIPKNTVFLLLGRPSHYYSLASDPLLLK